VLHWTSTEHELPNSMFERVASVFAGSLVAFYVLTEAGGVEQLRGIRRRAASLPDGWRVETDVSGCAHYVGPLGETVHSEAAVAAKALFGRYGIDQCPTTQVWKAGELVQQVGTVALEAALRKYVEDDSLYDKPPGVAGDCS